MQLANIHGTNSFMSGTNVTPDRTAKDSQAATNSNSTEQSPEKINPVSSIISQGEIGSAGLPTVGQGLMPVTEEPLDNAEEG